MTVARSSPEPNRSASSAAFSSWSPLMTAADDGGADVAEA